MRLLAKVLGISVEAELTDRAAMKHRGLQLWLTNVHVTDARDCGENLHEFAATGVPKAELVLTGRCRRADFVRQTATGTLAE